MSVVLFIVLCIIDAIGLHVGFGLAWLWSIALGIVLAVLGFIVFGVSLDGDGWDFW